MNTRRSAITKKLIDAGHTSVTEFADTWPAHTLVELATMVGGVSAIELEACLREEARESGSLLHFARSYLVRCLRENLAAGWGGGSQADFDVASAYGHWKSGLGVGAAADAERAFRKLKELRPPDGWLPEGEHDPLIEAAFEGLEFR
jgi:hypothetical protein